MKLQEYQAKQLLARYQIPIPRGEVATSPAEARRVAAALGSRTEAYRVLRDATVDRELARHGFRVIERHRQFVLPIALHKAIGSRAFTRATENLMARAGLLRLLGSPVTVVAARDRDGAR